MELIEKTLSDLKENITALRIDLAAEFVNDEELQYCRFLCDKFGFNLTIKIGGCDATNDIYKTKQLKVNSIIAPMIETPYAVQKFIYNCRKIYSEEELKNINLYPNIETFTAYSNFQNILSVSEIDYIKGFVLGRDDMAGSMNLSSNEINSDKMIKIAENIADLSKKYNKDFITGGGIRPQAVEFLNKIADKLTFFETRMIVFSKNTLSQNALKENIAKAIKFEILWLEHFKKEVRQERIEKLKNSILEKDNLKSIVKL